MLSMRPFAVSNPTGDWLMALPNILGHRGKQKAPPKIDPNACNRIMSLEDEDAVKGLTEDLKGHPPAASVIFRRCHKCKKWHGWRHGKPIQSIWQI